MRSFRSLMIDALASKGAISQTYFLLALMQASLRLEFVLTFMSDSQNKQGCEQSNKKDDVGNKAKDSPLRVLRLNAKQSHLNAFCISTHVVSWGRAVHAAYAKTRLGREG